MTYTILSVMPPLIAIALALLTKEVYMSLIIGIMSGAMIYSNFNPLDSIITMLAVMKDKIGTNVDILIFLVLLGILVATIARSGATRAYGEFARQRIKNKRSAMFLTTLLGIIIFIDDYFNCLTIGAVMRPVTDEFKIARVKLAYIIDATAAPICIIAPVSSWAAAVSSSLPEGSSIDGFRLFLETVPYNIYAWLTLIFLAFIIYSDKDYAVMRESVLKNEEEFIVPQEYQDTELVSKLGEGKGLIIDLILPLLVLIISSVFAMIYTGGGGNFLDVSLAEAFANCDAGLSLAIGSFIAFAFTGFWYLPRKIMTFKAFCDCFSAGFKAMTPAIFILCLAWTLSGICSDKYLDLGGFVGSVVPGSATFIMLLPPIFFLLSMGLALATGTSWGTFGILIPIAISVIGTGDSSFLAINIAAILSGAVAGDHASPISDTTILSSAGAQCPHLDHVNTQFPYVATVAICSFIGYTVSGLTGNGWIGMGIGIVCLYLVMIYILYIRDKAHSIVEQVFKKSIQAGIANKFARATGVAVDGVVVGTFLGVESLAAYGLAWPLTIIYALPGSTLSGGARNLFNQLNGRGMKNDASAVFNLGILLSLIFSVILSLITFIFMEQVATFLGASGESVVLLPLVSDYLLGLIIGIALENVAKYIAGFLPVDGNYKLVVTGVTVSIVTNIICDILVVVFLNGDLFMLGLATSFSRFCYLLVVATHFLRKERMLRFSLQGITTDIKNRTLNILNNSIPATIARLFASGGSIITNKLIAAVATAGYLAAFSIHKSLDTFVGAIYFGVGDTVWTLTSVYHGEEDKRALNELQKVTFHIGFSLTLLVSMLIFLFAPFIAGMYVDRADSQTYALAIDAIEIFAVSAPLYLLSLAFAYYLMGVGRLKMANNYFAMSNFGVLVPIVYIMVENFGGRGAWLSTPVILIVMLIFAVIYIFSNKDSLSSTPRRLLLESDFGIASEINISIDSLEEVKRTSDKALLFCKENNVDENKTNVLTRCIEELGSNIIKYGFSDGKEHSIDLRILAKKDEVVLRLRDDCPSFNVVNYHENHSHGGETEKHSGIDLVFDLATNVEYSGIMGTNNIIVKI